MKWNELDRLPCSVARSLAVVGDRWTLLILRSAFLRVRRFEDFQQQIGLTRHRLADRLVKLVRLGVFEKRAYQERPPRYEYRLTEKGLDLYPVLMALTRWGDQWLDEGQGPPLRFVHQRCQHEFQPVMSCSHCGEALSPREVSPKIGPGLRPPATAASAKRSRKPAQ